MVQFPRARRVALTLLLLALVAALALVVARALPLSAPRAAATATATFGPTATPSPTARAYPLYAFAPQLPAVSAPVRPGQTLAVTWQPQLDPNNQEYTPTPVACSVALFGRFASRAVAQQAGILLNSAGSPPPLPGTPIVWPTGLSPAVVGPTLTLDDVTPVTRTSTLVLPTDLSPGYYLLDALSRGADGSAAYEVILVVSAGA